MMKKCIVISDSFKGSLSSIEICEIAKKTFADYMPDCQLIAVPVADGGEGTVDCFAYTLPGTPVTIPVSGPFGETVDATYLRTGDTAILEMASAAGLPMAAAHPNPATSTTFGVGQLIAHAADSGCTRILLGIGGSATNDGGCGCAAALGVQFYNEQGEAFVPTGGTLNQIARIDTSACRARCAGLSITVMCDVDNPLYGQRGAACVFAPQKGADSAMVAMLDENLSHLAQVCKQELGLDLADVAGAGAAGGLGFGCMAFLGAELKSGIETVLDAVDFDSLLDGADLVITGEGRIDSQSVHGKVISGIANRTRSHGVPLVAVVGCIDDSAAEAYPLGVNAIFTTNRRGLPYVDCIPRAAGDYAATLHDVLGLIGAVTK